MSLVRLVAREGRVLVVDDLDVLDGTLLLDIKPYVTRVDVRSDARCGWTDSVSEARLAERGRRAGR